MTPSLTPTMQIVTFRLDGLPAEAYREKAGALAPVFAQMPGLSSKVWLADPEANVYGGVYTWSDRAAMERYVAGEIFTGLQATPGIVDVTSRVYGVLAEPTSVTG